MEMLINIYSNFVISVADAKMDITATNLYCPSASTRIGSKPISGMSSLLTCYRSIHV